MSETSYLSHPGELATPCINLRGGQKRIRASECKLGQSSSAEPSGCAALQASPAEETSAPALRGDAHAALSLSLALCHPSQTRAHANDTNPHTCTVPGPVPSSPVPSRPDADPLCRQIEELVSLATQPRCRQLTVIDALTSERGEAWPHAR